MKKCKFDDSIDDYLLSKLSEEDREKFEEHYFNCQQCFEKMLARDIEGECFIHKHWTTNVHGGICAGS